MVIFGQQEPSLSAYHTVEVTKICCLMALYNAVEPVISVRGSCVLIWHLITPARMMGLGKMIRFPETIFDEQGHSGYEIKSEARVCQNNRERQ